MNELTLLSGAAKTVNFSFEKIDEKDYIVFNLRTEKENFNISNSRLDFYSLQSEQRVEILINEFASILNQAKKYF